MKKIWFKNKSYGWGWTPCTWQGWLVLAAFIGYNVKTFVDIDAVSHSGSDTLIAFVMCFIGSTALLVSICYATGEKPRWRWGGK